MSDPKLSKPKAADAAQSNRNADEQVPSYSHHTSDDLYTDQIPNYGTGLPSFSPVTSLTPPPPDSQSWNPEDTQSLPPPPPPPTPINPLSLTLDKALIFPSTIPATALYSLNFTLNTMGNSIMLRRSVPGSVRASGTTGKIMDKDLYEITRPPSTLTEFEICGKRRSTFPGTGRLELRTGFRGTHWECKFKEKVVLKSKSGAWMDGEGKPVATEINEVIPKKGSRKGKEVAVDDGVRGNPGLVFEGVAVDSLLVDLMVAVWCAKTWSSETYELKTVPSSTAEVVSKTGHAMVGGRAWAGM